MALDLSKMRSKQSILDGNGGDKETVFWKPEEGDQDIRVVCPSDGDPFKEFNFHYLEVGNRRKTVLCPKRNFDDDCPICTFASSVWKDAAAGNDDEGKKLAKSLFVKQRYFSPVLVRGQEDKGIRVWGYGVTAYKNLLGLVLNPEYGDVTDTEEGTDLTITYGKVAGKLFPETTISPRRRTSPLCDKNVGGPARCAELLASMPDFGTLFERVTPQQAQNILDEFLADETSATEDSHYKTVASESSSIDDAYRELMRS
jgi:hypothetical protein